MLGRRSPVSNTTFGDKAGRRKEYKKRRRRKAGSNSDHCHQRGYQHHGAILPPQLVSQDQFPGPLATKLQLRTRGPSSSRRCMHAAASRASMSSAGKPSRTWPTPAKQISLSMPLEG